MGYLDNATTNVILDSVLTDKGRELLARNDGSFAIVKFAVGDDGVDYSVIKNFGRAIGKEKIEKNTPVFEALTANDLGLKYRCITIPDSTIFKLPNLSLDSGATNNVVSMSTTIAGSNKVTIIVTQKLSGQTFTRDLVDESYEIFVNNRFLEVEGARPISIDQFQVARYFLPRNDGDVSNGSRLTFTLRLKNITDTMFTTYGKTQDKTTILTYVNITGINTGVNKEFEVSIAK